MADDSTPPTFWGAFEEVEFNRLKGLLGDEFYADDSDSPLYHWDNERLVYFLEWILDNFRKTIEGASDEPADYWRGYRAAVEQNMLPTATIGFTVSHGGLEEVADRIRHILQINQGVIRQMAEKGYEAYISFNDGIPSLVFLPEGDTGFDEDEDEDKNDRFEAIADKVMELIDRVLIVYLVITAVSMGGEFFRYMFMLLSSLFN